MNSRHGWKLEGIGQRFLIFERQVALSKASLNPLASNGVLI